MDATNIAITTPSMTIAATTVTIAGSSMTASAAGTSLNMGTGVIFDSSTIVLVGKDGSFDLDVLYEVRTVF